MTGLFNRLCNRLFQVSEYYLVTVIIFNRPAPAERLRNHSTITSKGRHCGYWLPAGRWSGQRPICERDTRHASASSTFFP